MYEIPRQSGRLVILLHGLGESKNIFKPLIKPLEEKGYNVVAINYPSTRKSIQAHIDQLDFFLTHTEDISEVSFVTKGTGCLLLRYLLNTSFEWNKKFKIGKIVNVNPVNLGSEVCATLARFKIFSLIFGKALKECSPANIDEIPELPENYPLGLIFCETYFDKMVSPITTRFKGIDVPGDKKEEDFSPSHIHIKNTHLNVFDNPKLIQSCVSFLSTEKL